MSNKYTRIAERVLSDSELCGTVGPTVKPVSKAGMGGHVSAPVKNLTIEEGVNPSKESGSATKHLSM